MSKKSNIPPFFGQDFSSFKGVKFPGMNVETLLSGYQKNMELLKITQQIATEAAQNLMQVQKQYGQKLFGQVNQHAEHTFSKAPLEEKASHQVEAAKATMDGLIEHLRTTNSIITKSNEQMIEMIQKCFKESIDESSDLVKKSTKKSS